MTKLIDEIFYNIPKIFLIVMVILVLAHIGFMIMSLGFDHDNVFGLSQLFTLDDENTVPSWFSSIILFYSSLLLYIIYRATAQSNRNRFWIILSVIFLSISVDEMIALHEYSIIPLREYFNGGGIFYFS